MLNSNRQLCFRAIVLSLAVLPLAACIAHAPGSGSQSAPVSVTVTPSSENFLPVNGTLQFTATVTGSSNTGVTWSLQPNLGCNTSGMGLGAISAVGLYTAPPMIPISPCAIVVSATANADSTAQFQTLVYVQVAVTITSLPPQNQVLAGGMFQFAATVAGNSNQSSQTVQWAVNTANGGSIVASSGLYTAPSTPISSVNITATSVFDSSARQPSASATISVVAGPGTGAISVSPAGASIPVGGTYQFAATEAGVANPRFHWSVAGLGCGANVGSISDSGLYTAPPTSAILPASPCQVQIKASALNGASGSALANLHVTLAINNSPNNGPPNSVAPPAAIGAGANWLYSATVAGTDATHQGVTWNATTTGPGECTFPAGQFRSSNPPYSSPYAGFYVAPLCVPTAPVTITATSEFDPAQSVSTTVTIRQNDPVGTATGTTMTCPANTGGTNDAACYRLDVSCPGIANLTAYLKVNQPSGAPLGTVILAGSSGGNYTYDVDPAFLESDGTTNGGLSVVNGILNSAVSNQGFTTVQVAFSPLDNATEFRSGWLTGPGGVRRLACRYAAVAQWVYANIHNANTSSPMCATGNGGGAGAMAYALTDYGQNSIFSMVEATGGPSMSRLDLACVPSSQGTVIARNPGDSTKTLPLYYSLEEAAAIDPAYPADEPFCSNSINGTGTQGPTGLFLSDSLLGGPQPPDLTPTKVRIVLGALDNTAAAPQAQKWGQALSLAQPIYVDEASQAIPAVPDGARQIVTDIQRHCKLP